MSRQPQRRETRAPSPLVGEALAWLAGDGRHADGRRLLEGLRERFRVAGREKLADLVYELAKACLATLPELSVRTRLHVAPRRTEIVARDVARIADSLRSLPDEAAAAGAQLPRSSVAEAALADARRCLDVLAELEGDSGRQRLASALERIHAGRPEAGEALLVALLERADEAPAIRAMARVNLAFALLRQERYAEVVPLARAAHAEDPDNPVPLFNLLAALAELGVPEDFVAAAGELAALRRRRDIPLVREWMASDLAMLCATAGLDAQRTATLCALEIRPEEGD